MILHETEAMKRWCPLARSYWLPDGAAAAVTSNRNADGDPDVACMCLGSRCMAWRGDLPSQVRYVDTHQAEIAAWLAENPRPKLAGEYLRLTGEARRQQASQHGQALNAWADKASAFAGTLRQPAAPPDDLDAWTWAAGVDEEDNHPFARWITAGGLPRGRCGLAGRPD